MTRQEALGGFSASARRGAAWRHPWNVQCAWLPGSGRWVASILPGFVNGRAPIVRTAILEQVEAGRDYGINPLSGEPYFSSHVFSEELVATGAVSEVIDVPLYADPAIALSWRALGFDGDGSQAVPQFFKDRGAGDSPLRGLALGGPIDDRAIAAYASPPRGLRLLRACDLWLHQPRNALTSDIQVLPGVSNGLYTFRQTLGQVGADRGDVLSIRVGNFQPIAPQIDPVSYNYAEFPWDEKLLATVYLLSPPDATPGSEPDGTWQPYVQHQVFWNLTYLPAKFREPANAPGMTVVVTLGGGVAQPIVNYLTSEINDGFQRAFNLLQGHSLAGRFWTPTGGGASAEFPAEPVEEVKPGMRSAPVIPRGTPQYSGTLDPAFPYRGLEFDPTIFRDS